MKAIFKREFESLFKSPVGYVFVGLFLAFSAIVFTMTNIGYASTVMTNYFVSACYVFIVAVPLLTMKMFSEERKLKTDQLLLTSPVKVSEIVFGKFFSGVAVLAIAVATTTLFLLFMAIYGNPAISEAIIGYVGIILYGGMLISIGMFISTLTQSQVISAVGTMAVVGFLMIAGSLNIDFTTLFNESFAFVGAFLNSILKFLNASQRYHDFASGTLTLVSLFYFLSITALFILLTVRMIEKRRWR